MIPIWVSCYKDCNGFWVVLGGKSCPVEGLWGGTFMMGMGESIAYPFVLECRSY